MGDYTHGTSFRFLANCLFCILIVVVNLGCTKPDAGLQAEWNTPKEKCADCHSNDPNFKTIQIAKHSEVHCLECHEINPNHYSKRKSGFDGNYENVIIREDRCLICHPTDRYSNAGHWRHLGVRATIDSRPMQCIDCHTEGHNLSLLNDCAECHAETIQEVQNMAIGHCTICHGFVRTSLMSKSRELHPYEPKICSNCHELEDESAELNKDSFRAALLDPHISKTNCAVCHSPHKAQDPGEEITCRRCHKMDSLNKVGAHRIREHLEFGCNQCHEPHHFGLSARGECKTCHSGYKLKVYETVIQDHKECNLCHTNNDYSQTVRASCVACHDNKFKELSNGPKQHRNCDACHNAHEWENPSVSACSKCHSKINTESIDTAVKQDCTLCHDSHSAAGMEIPSGCADCHTTQVEANSSSPVKSDCSICHIPHQWKASGDRCNTCHSEIESGLHKEHFDFGCQSCHTQHNWKPQDRSICLACHTDYEDHMDSGVLCTDCHW